MTVGHPYWERKEMMFVVKAALGVVAVCATFVPTVVSAQDSYVFGGLSFVSSDAGYTYKLGG